MSPTFIHAIIVAALTLAPAAAEAVSFADIIELTRAGLGDEVIIALIQADDTIYGVDADKLMELRRAGVSEVVLKALLRNGRDAENNATDPAPVEEGVAPKVIVIDHHDPPPASPPVVLVQPVFVPVIVPYVPVLPVPAFGHAKPRPVLPGAGFGRFINDGFRPADTSFGRFLNDGYRPPD